MPAGSTRTGGPARNSLPARLTDTFRTQLWPLPALAVLLAVTLGTLLPSLEAAVDEQLRRRSGHGFGGGREAARSILQAISGL
jgi:uncharacterized membrane protein